MLEPRRNARARAIWVLTLVLSASCARSPEALASFGSQTLTIADLDAYLLGLPEAERQVPAGTDSAAWMEQKIRRLALEKVLESSEEAARLRTDSAMGARRLWLRSTVLVSAISKELAGAATPGETEVKARVEELARQRGDEPLLNFGHVYFRLDLAKTPRERRDVRALAEAVAAEARAGADFSALARQHSDSSDAAAGGLVMSARPSDLDEQSQQALGALAEDEVSAVIETRTGLHIFRLVRRLTPQPPAIAELEASARNLLVRERFSTAHDALLEDLRARFEVRTEAPPWRIGSWTLDAEVLGHLLPEGAGEDQRNRVVDRFLLAEEALARGLEPPDLADDVGRRARLELLERLFNTRRGAFDAEIGAERLRAFYDAQPTLFNEREKVHLELIFMPQGDDSFTTQKRAEAHVAELRAGASFAELARRVSTGPGAENGGDLGPLEARAFSRLGPAVGVAVPRLEVGEISDPIYCTGRVLTKDPWLLRGGFAILRIRDRVADHPRDFEDAIEDVRRVYSSDHRARLDEELQAKILDEAGLEILRLPDVGDFLR